MSYAKTMAAPDLHSRPEGVDTDHFNTHGYLRIPGVFTPEEVEDMRERIRATEEEVKRIGRKSDLMSHPELRPIMLDERVLSVARRILGSECVYFGWSTYFCNDPGVPHMHNDAKGDPSDLRAKNKAPPSKTDWPIIRIGIYLQDHSRHSGGLKVRDRSHNHYLLTRENIRRVLHPGKGHSLRGFPTGRLINIPSRPGDLVVFNMRTHHSGHFLRLRALPDAALHPGVEKLLLKILPDRFFLPEERERNVLFTTFGNPSPQLEGFIANRALRPGNANHWRHAEFHRPENVRALEERGIRVDPSAIDIFERQQG